MRTLSRETRRYLLTLLLVTAGLMSVWLVIDRLVAPALIESAYHERALPVFNDALSGRADHPLEHYFGRWQSLSRGVFQLIALFALISAAWLLTLEDFQRVAGRIGRDRGWLGPTAVTGGLTAALAALIVVLFVAHPVGFVYLIEEDRWGENGSFVAFGIAGCLLMWAALRAAGLRRIGLLLFGLAAAFVALEEISWGQRMLSIGTPKYMADVNIQRELNLHNLLDKPKHLGTVVVLWAVGLPLVALLSARVRGGCDRLGIPLAPARLWPLFLIAGLLFQPTIIPYSEEAAEMLIGLGLAMLALEIVVRGRAGGGDWSTSGGVSILALMLYIGVVTALLMAWALGDRTELHRQMREFASHVYPGQGMNWQADKLFAHLERIGAPMDVETRMWAARVRLEVGRRDEATAMLDDVIGELEEACRVDPQSPDSPRLLAQALHIAGREDDAKRRLDEALALYEPLLAEASGDSKAKIRLDLGYAYVTMERPDDARRAFEHAAAEATTRSLRSWAEVQVMRVEDR